MQIALCTALCLSLSVAPTSGAPSGPVSAAQKDVQTTVDAAEQAWSKGRWTEVRRLLEPLAEQQIDDPVVRQKLYTLLADATISDGTLDQQERRELTTDYLNRILDDDPTWRMPQGIYSQDLFALYTEVFLARANNIGAQCRADHSACKTTVSQQQAELRRMRERVAKLERELGEQDMVIQPVESRTRALAIFPFGLSHFLNGDQKHGIAFLVTEVVVGAAGLGLLLYRTVTLGCRRTKNFQPGSLQCRPRREVSDETVVRARRAEEAMAYIFFGTMLFDVIWAQVRFKPKKFGKARTIKRKDLDKEDALAPQRKPKRRRKKTRAKVRPGPAYIPGGAGLGLEVRF